MTRGKFTVIEGLDGSGKSTQASRLAQALQGSLLTREPSELGAGQLCSAIFSKKIEINPSEILKFLSGHAGTPATTDFSGLELLRSGFYMNNPQVRELCRAVEDCTNLSLSALIVLLIADRMEHLDKIVSPALEAGRDVICDRYYLSNMAYQGRPSKCSENDSSLPKGFSLPEIYDLNKRFGAIAPDLTIYLSLCPQKAIERIKSRSNDRGIFDELQVLEQINENYQKAIEITASHGEKTIVVCANRCEDEIAAEILNAIR